MGTIGAAFSHKSKESENNFLPLRLIAASLVVYGHAFALAAPCDSCHDFVSRWLFYRYSGDVGLHAFFAISGFLVFASFDKRRNLGAFAIARALRIFPALLVCLVILTLIIGPLFSSLTAAEYFSAHPYRFFLSNATLYEYVAALPGIFSANRMALAADGTLWTLGIEARLYLLIALFGVFGWISNRRRANISIIALLLIAFFEPSHIPLIGDNPNHLRLGAFFALGSLFYVNRDLIPLNKGALLLLVLSAALSLGTVNYEIACGAVVVYGVFWIAFSSKIRMPFFIQDYSYGIYLYGWPIEQIINYVRPQAGPYCMILIALPTAWLIGAASWFLIEKPCLSFKSKKNKVIEVSPHQVAQ